MQSAKQMRSMTKALRVSRRGFRKKGPVPNMSSANGTSDLIRGYLNKIFGQDFQRFSS